MNIDIYYSMNIYEHKILVGKLRARLTRKIFLTDRFHLNKGGQRALNRRTLLIFILMKVFAI